jgi:hypothetical protein
MQHSCIPRIMGLCATVSAVNKLANKLYPGSSEDSLRWYHCCQQRLELLRRVQFDFLTEYEVRRLLEVMYNAPFKPLLDEWAIVADKLPPRLWVPYFRWTDMTYSTHVALFRRFALMEAIETPPAEYCKYVVTTLDLMLAPMMLQDIWPVLLRHDSASFWNWFWLRHTSTCFAAPTMVPGTPAFSSFLTVLLSSTKIGSRFLQQRLLRHPETHKFLAPHLYGIEYMCVGVVHELQPALIEAARHCRLLAREASIVYRLVWIAACVS